MKTLPRAVYWLVCACVIVCSRQIVAQVVSCPATVTSPGDLSIQLSLNHGQTVFRQGEIVGLVIRYSSQSLGKYLLNNRSHDRSGRLDGADLLCLQPDIGTDPLDDYFHSYAAFMGGGLFSKQQIGAGHLETDLELNEWRSLPPGQYRLSVLSERVSLGKEGDIKSWNNAPAPVQSNWVSFQIVKAEPTWQSSVFSDAIKTLDSPTSTPDEKEHATRVLRFLNSEDASRELVRRFWHSSPENRRWDFEAGLFGTPFRQTAIQAMRAVLRDSRDATKDWFIDVLVNLELQSDARFRQLRYGTRLADRDGNQGSLYEAERKRRVSAYKLKVASGAFK
jgi:hypothetical protein